MTNHVDLTASASEAAPARTPDASAFRYVAGALLVSLLWLIAWYWSTASQIAGIWWRSETFAHGLVVLPISAWLLWNKRREVGGLMPEPVAWMVIPVLGAGIGWLLGQLVNINALAHFSLVTMLVAVLVGVLGWRLSRLLAFPLAFLFFGVPIGEFLMPTLMHYTAEFTVLALRISGVPVYQEGLFFVVPNGRWSVVEACSGIRYLIASLMVGTLYAYLNYRSPVRRALFVGVAIIVPIVANWLRAYLIVMIGYLTDNKVAAGVDHLIYGWLFFGVVILMMFWIGARWREDVDNPASNAAVATNVSGTTMARRWPAIAMLAGATALFPLLLQQMDEPVEPFTVELRSPAPQPGWTTVDMIFHDYQPIYSGYRGKLYQAYRHESGAVLGLYVAYYARQRPDAELIAWANRLTTRDENTRWMQVINRIEQMPPGQVRRTVVSDRDRRIAVWHWYRSNDRTLTDPRVAKALLALNRLTGQPDDAAFVAVLVPVDDRGDEIRPLVESFLQDHWPDIESMLGKAAKQR